MSRILRVLSRGTEQFATTFYRYKPFLLVSAAAASAGALFKTYVYDLSFGDGPSNYPTIPDRLTYFAVNKRYHNGHGLAVGDFVCLYHPLFPKYYLAKRVVGMPGDIVIRSRKSDITPGGLPMPGVTDWKQRLEVTDERSHEEEREEEPDMIQVPEGHIWVEGDNLPWSRDSRTFGAVPMALVFGRIPWFAEGMFSYNNLRPGKGLRRVEDHEMEDVLGPNNSMKIQ